MKHTIRRIQIERIKRKGSADFGFWRVRLFFVKGRQKFLTPTFRTHVRASYAASRLPLSLPDSNDFESILRDEWETLGGW
jgi:hypothetical protein